MATKQEKSTEPHKKRNAFDKLPPGDEVTWELRPDIEELSDLWFWIPRKESWAFYDWPNSRWLLLNRNLEWSSNSRKPPPAQGRPTSTSTAAATATAAKAEGTPGDTSTAAEADSAGAAGAAGAADPVDNSAARIAELEAELKIWRKYAATSEALLHRP
jgi:hypothetical protein